MSSNTYQLVNEEIQAKYMGHMTEWENFCAENNIPTAEKHKGLSTLHEMRRKELLEVHREFMERNPLCVHCGFQQGCLEKCTLIPAPPLNETEQVEFIRMCEHLRENQNQGLGYVPNRVFGNFKGLQDILAQEYYVCYQSDPEAWQTRYNGLHPLEYFELLKNNLPTPSLQ